MSTQTFNGSNETLGEVQLECKDLAYSYSGSHVIFKDINIKTYADELVAIVGPSGTGKSTLIRVLANLIPPTAGHVFLNGVEVKAPSSRISLVHQSIATFPYLVTGLSSTINSAWGGLAVAEYWPHIFGNQTLQVHTGMMKIISASMVNGNMGLAAWTSLLFAIVVGIYSIFFTRNLMDLARKKYVIEEGIYAA